MPRDEDIDLKVGNVRHDSVLGVQIRKAFIQCDCPAKSASDFENRRYGSGTV